MGMSPQEQEEVRKDPSKLKEKFNRFIIRNTGMDNNYIIPGEGGKAGAPVDIMQGKPQVESLANYVNYTVDRAFNICGYNSPWGTKEHATNKTTSEISVNMQNDMLTTSLKKNMREPA